MRNLSRYFNSPPEVIRIAVMLYIRYTLSLRQIEDLLYAESISAMKSVPLWSNRFGPDRSGARAATSPWPRNCFPPSLPVT